MIRVGLMKIIMWAIVPVALTLILLVTVDFDKPNAWINLTFIWLAYILASVTCTQKVKEQLAVLNWTIYACAIGYFLTEAFLAILFLYVYTDVPEWAFSIQLLLLVVYILLFGFVFIAHKKTEKQIAQFHRDVNKVKQWKSKAELVRLSSPSEELSQLLDMLSRKPSVNPVL